MYSTHGGIYPKEEEAFILPPERIKVMDYFRKGDMKIKPHTEAISRSSFAFGSFGPGGMNGVASWMSQKIEMNGVDWFIHLIWERAGEKTLTANQSAP